MMKKLFNLSTIKRIHEYSQLECKEMIRQANTLRDRINEYLTKFQFMKLEHYWKMCLTDPQHGYYASRNVFSAKGDFITSPQITPLFGEMIGVWIVHFLQVTKNTNTQLRIVQLGGGRGHLIKDILKTLQDCGVHPANLSFIQVSAFNRKEQQKAVMDYYEKENQFFKFQYQVSNQFYELFTSQTDKVITLSWHSSLEEFIQKDQKKESMLTIFVMNQFFDALPISVVELTENGWKEQIIRKSNSSDLFFQLGIHQAKLPPMMQPKISQAKVGDTIQMSPQSFLAINSMSTIIERYGGAIINVDYGDSKFFQDSIRAIKQHKYVPKPYFWQLPGLCDLSSYVNFAALAHFAENNPLIRAFPLLPQGYFLEAMGINKRIQILMKKMKPQQQERLQGQYTRLVSPKEMGEIYKVQIITRKDYGQIYPFIFQEKGVY